MARKPKIDAPDTATIGLRAYCHGLGDCLLLTLPQADGARPLRMLIDCGLHSSAAGNAATIRKVVEDIRAVAPHLDIVVGTHEHWDHLSGFGLCADLFAKAGAKDSAGKITVGEVWFGWTEDPADPLARQIDRYKGDAIAALSDAQQHLAVDPHWKGTADGIASVLGFVFGATGEKVRAARENLRALSGTVRHLRPGTVLPLGPVRAYVLGPPRDPAQFRIDDGAADTYHLSAAASMPAAALRNGLAAAAGRLDPRDDPLAPFDACQGASLSAILQGGSAPDNPDAAFLAGHYAGSDDDAWRRIDNDWLGASADLALQLDSHTNNTSLVLALEIVATGKVLIFAADAQVGNWRSWAAVAFPQQLGQPKALTGADLLARAIFYKVGHHGSSNATLSINGLELMNSPDLGAFIPTDQAMARAVGWGDIPARALLERLERKTAGRVIRSDSAWIGGSASGAVKPGGAFRAIDAKGLYVDLTIG